MSNKGLENGELGWGGVGLDGGMGWYGMVWYRGLDSISS